MLNKRRPTVDNNVGTVDRATFIAACKLESELSLLALFISLYPDQYPVPRREIERIFANQGITIPKLEDGHFTSFIKAARTAHRLESSLRVEQPPIKGLLYFENLLTLRIKFYHKKDREEFLEWYMVFKATIEPAPSIHAAGMTGKGAIGLTVMA
jgi:hypothetical protein